MSRSTLMRQLSIFHHEYEMELIEKLKNVKYVCETCDIWSTNSRIFIGITVHWLNETTLQRDSAALACR